MFLTGRPNTSHILELVPVHGLTSHPWKVVKTSDIRKKYSRAYASILNFNLLKKNLCSFAL